MEFPLASHRPHLYNEEDFYTLLRSHEAAILISFQVSAGNEK